jgi:hypothetical protein
MREWARWGPIEEKDDEKGVGAGRAQALTHSGLAVPFGESKAKIFPLTFPSQLLPVPNGA